MLKPNTKKPRTRTGKKNLRDCPRLQTRKGFYCNASDIDLNGNTDRQISYITMA